MTDTLCQPIRAQSNFSQPIRVELADQSEQSSVCVSQSEQSMATILHEVFSAAAHVDVDCDFVPIVVVASEIFSDTLSNIFRDIDHGECSRPEWCPIIPS